MQLSHCFFAGVPSESDWSQSYAHPGEGAFFGFVVHVGAQAGDVTQKGKQILSEVMEAATEINREKFLTLFKRWEEIGVDLGGIYIEGSRVVLYTKGDVNILLSRGGNAQTILAGKESGQYVEGECRPEDYFTLATTDFLSNYPDLSAATEPQDTCDAAVSKLHQLTDSSRVTALFIKAAGETNEVVVEPALPPVNTKPMPAASARIVRPNVRMGARAQKLLKVVGAVVAALILLLALSWFLSSRRQADIAKTVAPYETRYSQLMSLPASQKLDQLRGLRELSRDLTERIQQAKEVSLRRAYQQLLTQVDQSFASGSGETHYDKLQVYYDFRLIAPDFVATGVAFDDPGKLAVFLDGSHSRLLSLSLETKEALTLSVGDQLTHPFALAVGNRKAYVLGDSGVMELSLPLNKLGSVVISQDPAWVSPKLIDVFGTNAYLFDSGARNILKYDLTNSGSSPSGWMRSKEGVDFESVISMRVDGGVWLGENSGKIFHFQLGIPSDFGLSGVLDAPSSSVYVFTSQDSDKLYVLEPRAKRLMVLDKNGSYQKSITSDDLATTTGLIVNEATNKAYILSGSLVYEVPLQ